MNERFLSDGGDFRVFENLDDTEPTGSVSWSAERSTDGEEKLDERVTKVEAELQGKLAGLGFDGIKLLGINGRVVVYGSTSGHPIMDAPLAVLIDGHVVLGDPYLPGRPRRLWPQPDDSDPTTA